MEIRDILAEAKTKNYFDDYFAVIFGFVTLFLDFWFILFFLNLGLNAPKRNKQVSCNNQSVFHLWIG